MGTGQNSPLVDYPVLPKELLDLRSVLNSELKIKQRFLRRLHNMKKWLTEVSLQLREQEVL